MSRLDEFAQSQLKNPKRSEHVFHGRLTQERHEEHEGQVSTVVDNQNNTLVNVFCLTCDELLRSEIL